MEEYTFSPEDRFWVDIMNRLNRGGDLIQPIPEVLRDTCAFFDFGFGYIYQANYTATFYLRENCSLYPHSRLPDPLDLSRRIGPDELDLLAEKGSVRYAAGQEEDALARQFAKAFRAQSLVLLPVTGQSANIIALVGLADRRSQSRKLVRDMDFVQSILSAVANHVKLQMYQDRLEATMASLENVMDNMGVDLYVNDYYTHEILYANHGVTETYGGDLVGKVCWEALAEETGGQCALCPQPHVMDALGQPSGNHTWDFHRTRDGRWMHMIGKAFHWVDGRLALAISGIDVTEKMQTQELVQRLADYDTLTGLLNRRRLLQDMQGEMGPLGREGREGYVLFMDLDGFKQVNDTLGHQAGDELLHRVGEALLQGEPMDGNAYRNGGDEFVVLCHQGGLAQARATLEWLGTVFDSSNTAIGLPNYCRASIGVACYPQDAGSVDELLHRADTAMYAAKQAGGGQAIFYNQGQPCGPEAYYAAHTPPAPAVGQ